MTDQRWAEILASTPRASIRREVKAAWVLGACILIAVGIHGCAQQTGDDIQRVKTDSAISEQLRRDYVMGGKAAEGGQVNERWLADLEERYAGTIDVNAPAEEGNEHYQRFAQLMREWNPLHHSPKALEAIAGPPRARSEDTMSYRFRSVDPVEPGWRFKIVDNRIMAVEYVPGQ